MRHNVCNRAGQRCQTTLREANLLAPVQCGGMRTLLNALVDPTFSDQHDSLLAGVLYAAGQSTIAHCTKIV
jgi:hypothetical protein